MNRGYTREWYLKRIEAIRELFQIAAYQWISFLDFALKLKKNIEYIKSDGRSKYDFGYMFSYSERPNTQAQRKLNDDIPAETKRRLQEIIDLR